MVHSPRFATVSRYLGLVASGRSRVHSGLCGAGAGVDIGIWEDNLAIRLEFYACDGLLVRIWDGTHQSRTL